MKFLLDTNACIQLLRAGQGDSIRRRLDAVEVDDVVIYSVVRAELLHGAMRSQKREHNLTQARALLGQFLSIPFDDAAADHAAEIRAALGGAGSPIGPNDVLIAAIAPVPRVDARNPQHRRVQKSHRAFDRRLAGIKTAALALPGLLRGLRASA